MNDSKHKGFAAGWLVVAGTCALLASPWAMAQRPTIPAAEAPAAPEMPTEMAEQLDELDEVQVIGGRLYDRIVKAEERFFQLYNELNTDDDFDTNCANVPIDSDSRIEQRFCMPSFFADAKAESVRLSQYCMSLRQEVAGEEEDSASIVSEGPCYQPPSADLIFFSRRNAYVENMLKVIRSNSSLSKMYDEVEALHRERAMMARRYDDLKAQAVADRAERPRNRTTTR